jgi:perosamine synthetase
MSNSKNDNWILPLYKIYTDDEDIQIITNIVKRGSNWAIGPEILEFENEIKNRIGVDYCLTLNSGTSALHATLLAHNISNSHEVIIPSFSFIATANTVSLVNAHPIFCDIEEETFGLDPEKIPQLITKNTQAIMPMDYGGSSCKIFDIQNIAKENDLILIEDAAESFGATIKNKNVGSISDVSIFSFCGNKVLTTGEGGAIVTNSKEIYEKIKLIRSHGRVDKKNYFDDISSPNYLNPGYNWRMSSITAGLGISQIKKLDKIIDSRRKNAQYISSRISKYKQLFVPNESSNSKHIFQMYSVRLLNTKIRNTLQQFLTSKKIFSKVYFDPIHETNYYQNLNKQNNLHLEITEKISSQILTLPMYPNMTNEEKIYLIDSIGEFFDNYS